MPKQIWNILTNNTIKLVSSRYDATPHVSCLPVRLLVFNQFSIQYNKMIDLQYLVILNDLIGWGTIYYNYVSFFNLIYFEFVVVWTVAHTLLYRALTPHPGSMNSASEDGVLLERSRCVRTAKRKWTWRGCLVTRILLILYSSHLSFTCFTEYWSDCCQIRDWDCIE